LRSGRARHVQRPALSLPRARSHSRNLPRARLFPARDQEPAKKHNVQSEEDGKRRTQAADHNSLYPRHRPRTSGRRRTTETGASAGFLRQPRAPYLSSTPPEMRPATSLDIFVTSLGDAVSLGWKERRFSYLANGQALLAGGGQRTARSGSTPPGPVGRVIFRVRSSPWLIGTPLATKYRRRTPRELLPTRAVLPGAPVCEDNSNDTLQPGEDYRPRSGRSSR